MKTKEKTEYQQFSRTIRETLYGRDGYYFVTIAAEDNTDHFGDIVDGKMCLSVAGRYVEKQLHWLAEQYAYVRLDSYVVMPNHIHCILALDYESSNVSLQSARHRSLPDLIDLFKTTSSRLVHLFSRSDFRWQRRSFEHPIRSAKTLRALREFITADPRDWNSETPHVLDLFM
jgi:putative transposase